VISVGEKFFVQCDAKVQPAAVTARRLMPPG
jgi:hypothetical protein